jgi:hypothetical protein
MYKHIILYAAPGKDPHGDDIGICFSNSPNDTEDRIYLTGFPTFWHAWEFVLATTGRDVAQENQPEMFRAWRYKIPPLEEPEQLYMFDKEST